MKLSQQDAESIELEVVKRTASVFASFDPFIASHTWYISGNETPDGFYWRIREGLAEIRKGVIARQTRSDAKAIDEVLEISKAVEEMLKAQEPPDKTLYPTTEVDFARSNLDARVVLRDRVRTGLRILLSAIDHQLRCCTMGHFIRLKMTGFINEVDEQLRLFFDAYLSSPCSWKAPRWVHSRCIIANVPINLPENHGCQFLRSAEERNEDLIILLEEIPTRQSGDSAQEPQGVEYLVSQTANIQVDGCPSRCLAAPTKSLWELLKTGDAGSDSGEKGNSETFSLKIGK